MKFLSILFISFLLFISNTAFAQNWQVVWQDDFNTISSDWIFETGGGGWGNSELEYYRKENATIQNGNLVIAAKQENFGGYSYTSARMKTQGKKFWKYGKVEIRASTPATQGIWPAFWMLGESINNVGWPACGEIDILEHVNTGNTNYGTIHWANDQGQHISYGGNTEVSTLTNFHIFSIEWNSTSIKWFVDGVKYHEADITNGVNSTSDFHENCFLILNVAVGGNWPGNTIDNNIMPANLVVDYIKVYQDIPATSAPVINSSLSANATINTAFNYTITASNTPTAYNATGLPAGLNINTATGNISGAPTVSGTFNVNITASNSLGSNSKTLVISIPTPVLAPYGGTPANIPGKIEAEKYDTGGEGLAYHDMEAANNGTQMRTTEGIDIEACADTGGGYDVGWTTGGEWMTYTVNVINTGVYTLQARVSTINAGKTFHVELDGINISGPLTVPNTGNWQVWQTISVNTPIISAGQKILRIVFDAGDFNINYLNFSLNTCTNNTYTWIGTISTAWETADNWYCGIVPDSTTDVIINSGIVVINSTVSIKSLQLNTGVQLTVNTGKSLTILK
ncbi:MAG: family 16 glycosylhydrolase [Sphingobacteriales bacterium]|nr:family 16 glycosylhydrolase [Sphingobacteriales bacterium]